MIDAKQLDTLKTYPELKAFLEATERESLCAFARQLQTEYMLDQTPVTPFELVAALGSLPHLNSLKVLSDHEELINEYALYLAIAHGHLPVVQDLIQYYQLDSTGDTPNHAILRFAVGTGQFPIITWQLTKYPNTYHYLKLLTQGPLFFAAAKNHEETVLYFLKFPELFSYAVTYDWPFKNHVDNFLKQQPRAMDLSKQPAYTHQADTAPTEQRKHEKITCLPYPKIS